MFQEVYKRPNADELIGRTLRKANGIIRGEIVGITTEVFDGEEVDFAVLDNGEKVNTNKLRKW